MKYICEQEFITFGPNGNLKTSGIKCELSIKNMQLYNDGEIKVNFKSSTRKVINFKIGDLIQIDEYRIVIHRDNVIEFIDQKIQNYEGLLAIDNLENHYIDYPDYTNSPRVKFELSRERVELERIPEQNKDTSKANLLKKIIPAIIGIIIAILMLWVRPRGIRGILMLITSFVSFTISVINIYVDRRDNRKHNANRQNIYRNYLAEKQEELAQLKLTELNNYNYNFLSFTSILDEIKSCSNRLYERDIRDKDFLKLRIGTYTAKPNYVLNNPFAKLELRYEKADDELRMLYDEYNQIANVPMVIDFQVNTGLVGNHYVISEQLKNILLQIIFSHSYLDLKIIVITDEDYLADYKYAFSMKHFSNNEDTQKIFITNATERDQYLGSITQLLRARKQTYKQGMMFDQHYLFIIDNPALINNNPIMEFFESDEQTLKFSIIQIAKSRNELPKYIKTVIDFKTHTDASLELEFGKMRNINFNLPQIKQSIADLELAYLQLCNLNHIKGIKSSLPEQLSFLEMYEVNSPNELNIDARWQANHAYKSLSALMGKKSETDYLYLDLHEKVHGPHGLVAGTTGSGKSEVIQTYILSLALNFSPEQVGFLLIDYKGGGMANLFKDMPHHLGSITNLDGYQSMRALMSIKSELKRRQQIFANENVNHINAYQKLFEQKKVAEPLPHLFLISDEFAELKAEQPDFMKELVSAARIGRSLGIHLILATQKPDGVVDEQIWSNSKFKLSLKVAEEADSKALLKTGDAAYITNPGRGYLKVGNNELYELFQSGYSGGPLQTQENQKMHKEIYLVDEHGQKELLNPEECVDERSSNVTEQTELDAVLEEITTVYQRSNLKAAMKPWLPPLEDYRYYEYETDYSNIKPQLKIKLGLIDLPNQQKQKEYEVDFEENGNMLVVGAAAMGKTSTILSTILNLVSINTPELLKLFIFDIGKSGLINLKDLKHTSEYFTLDYDDKQKQFCSYITREINERKNLLMDNLVGSFKQYNQLDKPTIQAIFIVIDSYDYIDALEEDVANILKMLIEIGPNLGIYTIFTISSENKIKQNILLTLRNIVVLHTANHQEVSSLLKKTYLPSQEKPGRGFVLEDEVEVVQINMGIRQVEQAEETIEYAKQIELINSKQSCENKEFALMPQRLEYKKHKLPNSKLYAGQSYENLKMIALALKSMHISGLNKSGKTNFIKLILEQIKDEKKITILDDTSYSLIEYSESQNIIYTTKPDSIEKDSEVVIINKISRFDKIKTRELEPILEKLFLMHLNGTIFILESDSKGIKPGKADLWTMLVTAPYYIHFGNPITQNRYPVDKKTYKKEKFNISDCYIITDTSITKSKLPLVKTDNADKKYLIPELKDFNKKEKLPVLELGLVGANSKAYLNTLVTQNKDLNFKVFGNALDLTELAIVEITKEMFNDITPNEILILNGLESIMRLPALERREILEKIEQLEAKIILIMDKEYRLSGERLRKFKKHLLFTSNPLEEDVLKVCKRVPSKVKKLKIEKNEGIVYQDKIISKIKF